MRHVVLPPLLAPFTAVLLAACAAPAGPPGPIPVSEAAAGVDLMECGGAGLVRYVGHPVVRPGEPIPEEGAYVTPRDLPPKARVIGPNEMATMDFVPDRLTVILDANGRIRRLYCG